MGSYYTFPLDWAKDTGMLADGIEGVREAVRKEQIWSNIIKVGMSKGGVEDKYHPWVIILGMKSILQFRRNKSTRP